MTDTPEKVAKQYRKKPVTVAAMQFTGANGPDIVEWVGKYDAGWHKDRMVINTLEGQMSASVGDWIIRGVKGEFYPCKPDIFAATYEALDRPATDAPADGAGLRELADALNKATPMFWSSGDGLSKLGIVISKETADTIAIALRSLQRRAVVPDGAPRAHLRCTICGFVIDERFAAEKPTIKFGTAGRAPRTSQSGVDDLVKALKVAVSHINHMAKWIAAQNAGYSFESFGEDQSVWMQALATAPQPEGDGT